MLPTKKSTAWLKGHVYFFWFPKHHFFLKKVPCHMLIFQGAFVEVLFIFHRAKLVYDSLKVNWMVFCDGAVDLKKSLVFSLGF